LLWEFKIDIPSLTEDGVQMKPNSFTEVRKLQSSSIIDLELDADSLDRFIRKGIHNIGEVIKKNEYGITVLKGRVSKGKECG